MQLLTLIYLAIASFFTVAQASFIPSNLLKRAFGDATISKNSTNITGLLYTGGEYLTNISNSTNNTIVYNASLNTTNATLPELAAVSTELNNTKSSSYLAELVISAEPESLAKTGFYFALTYPNKTVVVTENVTKGLYVANATESFGRGGLIVNEKGVIYSAVSYPHAAIGFVTAQGKVAYFLGPSLPKILNPSSPLYTSTNFTAFNTSSVASNVTDIPIYNYTGTNSSTSLHSKKKLYPRKSYSSFDEINIVAVNSTDEANNYIKTHKPATTNSYVVFASYELTYIDTESLQSNNAIGAGFLSPVQVSILIAFAKSAHVKSVKSLFDNLV
ncbi:hypothetical protein QEN19_002269 [Hanseniaspora menglaensis]